MQCNICLNSALEKIINLPKLPLTGIFVSKQTKSEVFDQGLLYCLNCGHGQLENFLSPDLIYDKTYTFRSSKSQIARFGNDFLYNFIVKNVENRKFNVALDLGCNDLYLIKKLFSHAKILYGIDPIWKKNNIVDNVNVIGKFIENVNFKKDLLASPNIVISAHTFEHITNPKSVLELIVNNSSDDAIFFVEVPSLDTLINNHRFDQIFHQHLQYFSVASFMEMIHLCGCQYIDHVFNYNFWGGTMMFVFKKKKNKIINQKKIIFQPMTTEVIKKSYKIFKILIDALLNKIDLNKEDKFYGYGAAQMIPILAYHLGSDLNFLQCIYDENIEKDNLLYPNLIPKIKYLSDENLLKDKNVILLAIDSSKQILSKLISLKPKKILLPIDVA
ncbi:MAG: hypothetical protein A2888_02575 [Chlamydiae bacterium RIFCSPLOWO2_01_FULL_28_7]|nr:MAG: hypothetical protein A2888_02575 [Chlamydiae bacterium RIFCSPLOWO2_01_FULL_28_7]